MRVGGRIPRVGLRAALHPGVAPTGTMNWKPNSPFTTGTLPLYSGVPGRS
jgi:hypothetical protein